MAGMTQKELKKPYFHCGPMNYILHELLILHYKTLNGWFIDLLLILYAFSLPELLKIYKN